MVIREESGLKFGFPYGSKDDTDFYRRYFRLYKSILGKYGVKSI